MELPLFMTRWALYLVAGTVPTVFGLIFLVAPGTVRYVPTAGAGTVAGAVATGVTGPALVDMLIGVTNAGWQAKCTSSAIPAGARLALAAPRTRPLGGRRCPAQCLDLHGSWSNELSQSTLGD